MYYLRLFYLLFFGTMLIALLLLPACYLPEKNENDRNRALSEQEIQAYLKANNLTAQKTAAGLYYIVKQNGGSSRRAERGEQLTLHYTARLLSGRIFDSTSLSQQRPAVFAFATTSNSFPLGVLEGLTMMGPNDKLKILLPSHLGFKNVPAELRSVVPPAAPLIYELSLLSIKNEAELIRDYITQQGLTISRTTESGVVIVNRLLGNTGRKPETNEKIIINYVGKFLDDRIFDQNNNFSVTLRDNKVFATQGGSGLITAWSEVIPQLEKGDRVTIFTPSAAAYGERGTSSIPAFTPLIFEIEVVDIIT